MYHCKIIATHNMATTYVIYIFLRISWSYFLSNLYCMQGRGLGIVQCCAVGYETPYVAWYGASYETRLTYVTRNKHTAFVNIHGRVGFNALSKVNVNTNLLLIQWVCIKLQVFLENSFTSIFRSECWWRSQHIFSKRQQISTQHNVRPPKISSLMFRMYSLYFR